MGKEGSTFYLNNKRVSEAEYRRQYPLPSPGTGVFGGPSTLWTRGLSSDAAAIHPKQRAEHAEACRKRGLPEMQVRRDGRIVFRDRAHRRAYLKAFGFRDNDGGYGDG